MKFRCFVVPLCYALGLTSFVVAGDLNPPAGPVLSTMKNLVQVEPRMAITATNTPGDATSTFLITLPGSYYLTGDVIGEANKAAINITVSNVAVDLNGFSLIGMAGTRRGVRVTAGLEDVRIENGTIKNWGLTGLSNTSRRGLIRNVSVSGNAGFGIDAGDTALIESCIVESNGSGGISAGDFCQVRESIVRANAIFGISVGDGCVVEGCTATETTSVGAHGIVVGDGSAVLACVARGNLGTGIMTGTGCSILACTSTSNSADGYLLGFGGSIRDCVARFNGLLGISATAFNFIQGNTSTQNGQSGVGPGAGILVASGLSRIDGNHVTSNPTGIMVTATGSLIIRNTASGNATSFDIVAGNRYGPIVDITPIVAPAVMGDSAADSTNTTHPWANFVH